MCSRYPDSAEAAHAKPPLSVYLRSQGQRAAGGLEGHFLRPWWNQGHLSWPAPRAPLQPSPVRPPDGGRALFCAPPLSCRCDSRVTRMEQSWGVLRALLSSTGLTFCDFCPQRASPITDGLTSISLFASHPIPGRVPCAGPPGLMWLGALSGLGRESLGPPRWRRLGFPPSSTWYWLLHLETPVATPLQ